MYALRKKITCLLLKTLQMSFCVLISFLFEKLAGRAYNFESMLRISKWPLTKHKTVLILVMFTKQHHYGLFVL